MAHIEVYQAKGLLRRRKQYRWRIKAANGRILATGSEGYYNLGDLWKGVRSVTEALSDGLSRTIPIHDGKPPDA